MVMTVPLTTCLVVVRGGLGLTQIQLMANRVRAGA
jgi:hypothetical protein